MSKEEVKLEMITAILISNAVPMAARQGGLLTRALTRQGKGGQTGGGNERATVPKEEGTNPH